MIFILILLVLAFFIYGIFNPSWAARLWYNVRTFPQRVTSRISSGSEFLDYNTYKSKISSIWDEIWDKIWEKIWDKVDLGDGEVDLDLDDKIGIEIDENKVENEKNIVDENVEKDSDSQLDDQQTIKMFPKSVKFVEIPEIKEKTNQEKKSENIWMFTWYSKSDLLWIINKYIEKNLDDDTDILVTLEYEDDSKDPQKIILQTQHKTVTEKHSVAVSWNLLNEDRKDSHRNAGEKSQNAEVKNDVQSTKKVSSNKLTQKEQRETEELFSILF